MKLKLLLAVLFLTVFAPIASSQVQPFAYFNNALAPTGTLANSPVRMVTNATIRVCNEPASGTPCTPLATIYSDPGLSVPLANPFQADFYGNYVFYVPAGQYHVQQSGPQVAVTDIPYIVFGVGGGGGGGSPCGVLYDVQINSPAGTFGCDTGIFQEFPTTHTVIDYIGSFGQQVDVSDATHTGLIDLGHSNGSVVDGHFQISLDALTPPGYGIDLPNGAALGALVITSLTPNADGRLPTAWSTSGATVPCGATYDVQINSVGAFGCDTGVFTENPATHVLTEGGAAAIGQVVSNEYVMKAGSLPTFTGAGYVGIAAPPTSAGGALYLLPGAIGTDNQILTQISHSGTVSTLGWSSAVAGLVNYESLPDVFTANCPLPGSPCSDLISTKQPWGTSMAYMSNPPPTFLPPFVKQWCKVGVSVVENVSCLLQNPVTPGNYLVAIADTITGTGCAQSFTFSDALGSAWTNVDFSPPLQDAYAVVPSTAPFASDLVTVTLTLPGGTCDNFGTSMVVMELQDITGLDAHSFLSSVSWSSPGSPTNLSPVTTSTSSDAIIAMSEYFVSSAGVLSAGVDYGMVDQTYTPIFGPRFDVIGAEGIIAGGPGAYTPPIVSDGTPSTVGPVFTLAFHYNGPLVQSVPVPRNIRYIDLVASGDFPYPPVLGDFLYWGGDPNAWQLGSFGSGLVLSGGVLIATGGGDVITSPNSTLNVGGSSAATTLDVVGAAGEIMAGATPALTFTPQLGVDNTNAGTLAVSNGSASAHTVIGSAATTTNTILGPAVVIPSGHLVECSTSGTVCTFADGGLPASGTPSFSVLTSGTNTTAAMVVGAGASLDFTSTGTIDANNVNGATVPASDNFIGTNSSNQIVHTVLNRAITFQSGSPGGTALSTGVLSYVTVPFACTITGWSIEADAGTATIKFLKVAAGTAIPTLGGNSINTSGVALASGTVIQSSTVTDFTTTTVTANDIVAADMTATSGVGFINAQLVCAQ